MGMDYVGNSGNDFHLNWSGHTYMAQLLDMLGADLMAGGWAGSNDGDEITSAAAIKWAALLDKAIDDGRIKERKIPSTSYAGGFQMLPHVDDPVSTEYVEMYAEMDKHFDKQFGRERVAVAEEIVDLTDDTRDWIRSFATFLRDSDGAAQF